MVADENNWHPCPVTGHFDVDGEDPVKCAIREVHEETGYIISAGDLRLLAMYMVGTQTNERCYLYTCDVTGIEPEEDLTDETGEEGENRWQAVGCLLDCQYSACLIAYAFLKERN